MEKRVRALQPLNKVMKCHSLSLMIYSQKERNKALNLKMMLKKSRRQRLCVETLKHS